MTETRSSMLSVTWQIVLAVVSVVFGATVMGYLAVRLFFLPDAMAERQMNRIPDLSGAALEEARAQAADEGYVVVAGGERRSEEFEAGDVIYQLPPPGFYRPRGDTVRVLVSRGSASIALPDLAGLTAEDATAIVARLGLSATPARTRGSEIHPLGAVVETIPPAGTEVRPGTEVTFVLSGGGTIVDMPNLRGLSVSAAREALDALGLTVGAVRQVGAAEDTGGLVVVDQRPAPGQRVRSGSAAALDVGSGARR